MDEEAADRLCVFNNMSISQPPRLTSVEFALAWVNTFAKSFRRRHEHIFLREDELVARVVGELIIRPQDDGVFGTSLLAQTAKNASKQVDLVDSSVTFTM